MYSSLLIWGGGSRNTGLGSTEQVEFEQVQIPRFGLFDLYASNVDDSSSSPSHKVVARANQDTTGSSFVARLNYGRLGHGANLRRAIFSKHRVMYIGCVGS